MSTMDPQPGCRPGTSPVAPGHGLPRLVCTVLFIVGLAGCGVLREFQPSVVVKQVAPRDYIAQQRSDVLAGGELSARTRQTLRVTGLDLGACATTTVPACLSALAGAGGISDEWRLSALTELWLQYAMSLPRRARVPGGREERFSAWLEAARHAYGYLFFTARSPGDRAFEDRQTQVRDWYNYAVQQATSQLFQATGGRPRHASETARHTLTFAGWQLQVDLQVRLPSHAGLPQELLPASALHFRGLRSIYQRDGFGSEFVAVTPAPPLGEREARGRRGPPAWSEMPSPNITVVFCFAGETLEELLSLREVTVNVHDPLMESELNLRGHRVPLAGNYTAGYGLWLARSGFNRQSLSSLLGRRRGIGRPHLYMMQPFDPNRRILLMLHGLASSPEAWVNVANEILGDEELRREFQVWQVYYPTNMPVAINHAAIRRLLQKTLASVDPAGDQPASQDLVVIGHSMGGMIARLMVSTAEEQLWDWALAGRRPDPARLERLRPYLDPMLRFEPLPNVERVLFIATPHRGTPVAGRRLVRWLAGLVQLPWTLLQNIDEALIFQVRAEGLTPTRAAQALPTSLDNLDERDAFVRAAARLPIAERVHYHSIIARAQVDRPLEETDDGLVPYRSAHLEGARSEQVIVAGHSVQETAAAILEIRRILHEDLRERRPTP